MADESSNNSKELKQNFLMGGISDIATYIQLADTKVLIIMGSTVALIVGILACYQLIGEWVAKIKPCTWLGVTFSVVFLLCIISVVAVFLFGILTIRGHSSNINYESKWFLSKNTKIYSFDAYLRDVHNMSDEDVIDNMAAELYKLNDINRQKFKPMKWTIYSFSASLALTALMGLLVLINAM